MTAGLSIRPLQEADLEDAEQVRRLAFGTFLGLPEPLSFSGDAEYARGRWQADPTAAFAAELDGELVGSNFATRWGSFAFFGPLTVRPDLWERGIAQRLLERTIALFSEWGVRHSGLFTFPTSPRHLGLYQKFGFWPRLLTPILAKTVAPGPRQLSWSRFSQPSEREQADCLGACRALTDSIYAGLDLEREREEVR